MQRLLATCISAILMAGCSASSDYTSAPYAAYQPAQVEASSAPAATYPGWEDFGDWHVKLISDSMSATTHVKLFTRFNYEGSSQSASRSFGLEVFGDEVVTLSPDPDFIRKGSWPYCDLNSSMISVDGSKAVPLMPISNPGSCNTIPLNGGPIQKLLAGNSAKARIGSMDGTISLNGFKEAWEKARSLAK